MPATLQISDFMGLWQLRRRIDDQRAGKAGSFEGTAEITPHTYGTSTMPAVFLYQETGVLHYGDHPPLNSTQRYLWRQDGDRMAVLFSDGRPFHHFALAGPAPSADHFCDPDQYDVDYGFADWPVWQAKWRVTGPRKDYYMRSSYQRFDDGGKT